MNPTSLRAALSVLQIVKFRRITSQLNQHQVFLMVLPELFCYVNEVFLCSAKPVQTLCHLTNIFPGGFQVPCQIWRDWVLFKPLFDVTLLLLIFGAVYSDMGMTVAYISTLQQSEVFIKTVLFFVLVRRLMSELAGFWLMSLMT